MGVVSTDAPFASLWRPLWAYPRDNIGGSGERSLCRLGCWWYRCFLWLGSYSTAGGKSFCRVPAPSRATLAPLVSVSITCAAGSTTALQRSTSPKASDGSALRQKHGQQVGGGHAGKRIILRACHGYWMPKLRVVGLRMYRAVVVLGVGWRGREGPGYPLPHPVHLHNAEIAK